MERVKHQIEYKRLDEIRPYDNNPRRNDEAAKAVANSIREFGFQSPIIVDRDGVIIAGHTRYKAARRLKLQEVPVIVAAAGPGEGQGSAHRRQLHRRGGTVGLAASGAGADRHRL